MVTTKLAVKRSQNALHGDNNIRLNNRTNQISTTPQDKGRPSTFYVWWTACRPHTLTASICPCIVAYYANYDILSNKADNKYYVDKNWNEKNCATDSAAISITELHRSIVFLWFVFCISVQLGTNLHNDYSDYVKGADNKHDRIGHARATAMGWLSPFETCVAATLSLSVTLFCGMYIAVVTEQMTNILLWFLVLSSVFNAFAYTGGPYPLGYIGMPNWSIAYSGLGDIFVFLYFGLVATYMLPYLLYILSEVRTANSDEICSMIQASITQQHFKNNMIPQCIYGIQIGLLAMNILVVNNLRDRHTDLKANKLTTSVRFGRTFSIVQYIACTSLVYILVWINSALHPLRHTAADINYGRTNPLLYLLRIYLPLLCVPQSYHEIKSILNKEGAALNKHVGGAAKVQTLFCILLSISLYYNRDIH